MDNNRIRSLINYKKEANMKWDEIDNVLMMTNNQGMVTIIIINRKEGKPLSFGYAFMPMSEIRRMEMFMEPRLNKYKIKVQKMIEPG